MRLDALKQHKNWVCWQMRKDGDQLKKTPVDIKTGRPASSSDPATWAGYDECKAAVSRGDYHSLGFALTREVGLVVVDFDKVCHSDDGRGPGAFPEWVRQEIAELDSYTEISASKRGAHVLVWGSIPENYNRQALHIEIWGRDKMFAFSEDVYEGRDTIEARDVSDLHRRIREGAIGPGTESSPAPKANSLVARAPADFEKLWNGDASYIQSRYQGDLSAADQGLVGVLAHRTNGDREQIERLWLESPLGKRDKTQGREDYREITINRALRDFTPKLDTVPKRDAVIIPKPPANPEDWRGLFHTYSEFLTAPPLRFAIKDFLQEDGITFIGGLPGHGKTLVMLSVLKSLLTGAGLFNCSLFPVTREAQRAIYLVPESGIGPFKHRLELFGLLPFVESGRLFVRTMNKERLSLADPRLLKAAEGADVFLDTAVRFMEGAENAAEDNRVFAQTLFDLQSAGARTVVGAHHAPKAFENRDSMSLENVLRGSGDIGAMLATAWGIKQVDAAENRVYVQCIKARDFEPGAPFEITGRPFIDETGNFQMTGQPGLVMLPVKKRNRKEVTQAAEMRKLGHTNKEIATFVHVSERTIERWDEDGLLPPKADKVGFIN